MRVGSCQFSGTCSDSTLSDTRLDFYFFGTCPNFYLFGTCPDSTLSSTRLDFYFFGICSDSTISRYSLGFHLFDTRRDSTFSGTHPYPTFSSTCPDPSSELAWISSPSPASPPDFIIFFSIVLGSLIFLGIVPGFL